ncbi:MAG TPA: metalloregulator ArsR/SmtB family transcription factor [Rhizomicrobium sp.]|jgi:ArsR family transcriptional regulator
MQALLSMLRAAGDPTRLRILFLLREAELTVSELTQILGQSQPRVSRHLKLLCDANLLQRFKEGSWVFYRSIDRGSETGFINALTDLAIVDGEPFATDRQRLAGVRRAREAAAAAFFRANAADWQRIRSLHAPEQEVEAAILLLMEKMPRLEVLDAGTGTGRMLELLGSRISRGTGVDVSPDMLAIARDRLERAGMLHCQVRMADIRHLPFPCGSAQQGFDIAVFHQVLHYLENPQAAVIEAARVLKPQGRVLIVDFAPHELEFCRSELAHRRLGFGDDEVRNWFASARLELVSAQSIEAGGDHHGNLTVRLWLGAAAALELGRHAREAA